jgi:hypothetical protein
MTVTECPECVVDGPLPAHTNRDLLNLLRGKHLRLLPSTTAIWTGKPTPPVAASLAGAI